MAKQRKPGGRVTPKGTKNPGAAKRDQGPEGHDAVAAHQHDLPDRVRRSATPFAARPVSHNRGNR